MGYDHRQSSPAAGASPRTGGVPGKRTRTSRLPPRGNIPGYTQQPVTAPDLTPDVPLLGRGAPLPQMPSTDTIVSDEDDVTTGNQLADDGPVCEAGGPGCFLEEPQRNWIIVQGVGRYNAAEDHFNAAASALDLKVMLEKPTGPSFMTVLLLESLGLAAAGAFGQANAFAHHAGEAALKSAKVTATTEALEALLKGSEKSFDKVIEVAVELGKKGAEGGAERYQENTSDRKKDNVGEWLDGLRDQMASVFKALRETAPAVAKNDAELLIWFNAADPDKQLHTPSYYKAILNEKLARFKAAGMDTLGESHLEFETYTKSFVAWHRDPITEQKRLARFESHTSVPDPRFGQPKFEGSTFVNWIPEEFAEAAVAINEKVYGEIETIDYWLWDVTPTMQGPGATKEPDGDA